MLNKDYFSLYLLHDPVVRTHDKLCRCNKKNIVRRTLTFDRTGRTFLILFLQEGSIRVNLFLFQFPSCILMFHYLCDTNVFKHS